MSGPTSWYDRDMNAFMSHSSGTNIAGGTIQALPGRPHTAQPCLSLVIRVAICSSHLSALIMLLSQVQGQVLTGTPTTTPLIRPWANNFASCALLGNRCVRPGRSLLRGQECRRGGHASRTHAHRPPQETSSHEELLASLHLCAIERHSRQMPPFVLDDLAFLCGYRFRIYGLRSGIARVHPVDARTCRKRIRIASITCKATT